MDLREIWGHPCTLSANPNYHDHIHSIHLGEGGSLRMVDGGGQALRREIVGRLRVLHSTVGEAVLQLYELRDIDVYGRSRAQRPIEDLTLMAQVETGPFALRREVLWDVSQEDEPWLLFDHRVVFSEDPLSAGWPRQPEWPKAALDNPEVRAYIEQHRSTAERARRYYMNGIELTRRDLSREGNRVLR